MNKSDENAWRESLYTKEANDQYRACLAFFTRYFSFCDIKKWSETKDIPRHDFFIGTHWMSVKHLFEEAKVA